MEGITRYQRIADDQISVSTRNKERRKDRFPSCSSSSSCDTLNMENTDDAYHEDGLPDLVLDHQLGSHLTLNDNPVLNIKVNEEGINELLTNKKLSKLAHSKRHRSVNNIRKEGRGSSSCSLEKRRVHGSSSSEDWYSTSEGCDSSVIDLILSMTGGRRSISDSDVHAGDANLALKHDDSKRNSIEDESLVDLADDELVACAAERRENGFRVTFTDNRKVYVAPKPNSNYDFLLGKDTMYRSYLSLMPDGEEDEAQNQLLEERRAILEQFSKLSGREQELQRRSWTDELSNVIDEITTIRGRLRECKEKQKRLRKNIAMSKMESIKKKMVKVRVEVGEKVSILGEKSEECVTVIEKAAKKSLTEMEGTLNFLGERSGECVNLIDRVAKKSLGQLKATLQFQDRTEIDVSSNNNPEESENHIVASNEETENDINENEKSKLKDKSSVMS